MITAILTAAACVTAIGVLCAVMLACASKFMSVKVDETQVILRESLPGANCGACGYTGCDGYAKVLAEDKGKCVKINLCIPGGDNVSKKLSEILCVDFEDVVEEVATVRCCGDCTNTTKKAQYSGYQSCAAAAMIYGGEGSCTYGCIGLGDCAKVCPYDAICMENGIARVDTRKCTGCTLCTKACPNNLIHMMPDVDRVVVACNNRDKGVIARKNCKNACIACMKCEKICPTGAIKVTNNLASIDYNLCTKCEKCAEVCPVGCIRVADYSGSHRF